MSEKIPQNTQEAAPGAASENRNPVEHAEVTIVETRGNEDLAQVLKKEADKIREKHRPNSPKNESVSENTSEKKTGEGSSGHHGDGFFLGSAKNTGAFFGLIFSWVWEAIKRAPEMAGGGGGGGGHAKKDDHGGGGHH